MKLPNHFGTITVLLVIASVVVMNLWWQSKRSDFGVILDDLQTGRVGAGDATPDAWLSIKPTTFSSWHATDGRELLARRYVDGYGCVSLYLCDGRMFAAHYFQGVTDQEDRWYFCDEQLFAAYVQLASQP
jgi:hypothetical protein